MSDKMNVGFLGCGGFVQGNHLPNAFRNPNLQVRALCDLNETILADLKGQYAPAYVTTDYRRLVEDKAIAVVVIGTTPEFRAEPIRALAQAGKHLYVEKPMSLGYEDSREIVEIVRRTGIKLQVGFNRPYCRIMQEAKRIFRKLHKGPTLISYRIVGEDAVWPKFHRDNVASGKSHTIIHELTHIFNLLNWLTDRDPLRVYTIGELSDNNVVTISYPDQIHATIISGSCGTEAHPKERMEIFSDNKVLVMNEFVELECTRIPGERDQVFPLKSNPMDHQLENVPVSALRQRLMIWRDRLTPEQIKAGYYYNSRPSVNKGHAEALQALFEAVRDDTPIETDAYHGALATCMGLEAVRSWQLGRPVDLEFRQFKKGDGQMGGHGPADRKAMPPGIAPMADTLKSLKMGYSRK